MSESDTIAWSQPERRRRAHTRSRNGCFTCKHRHARCDEKRPVCTNCLTKGGACGYPEAVRPKPTSTLPSASFDPFDCLPVPMPFKSHVLWHHFVHYRMFTRSPVPKNPVNNFCVALAMKDPGLFHGCILLSAMNWCWNVKSSNTTAADIQQTYLHHKVQAIALVKERLAQNDGTEHVVDVITLLALVESGMGEIDAADAHLNAVANLLDMDHTEKWELEHYGLMQRAILLAGCYVAAARGNIVDPGDEELPQQKTWSAHYTRRPSTLFSTAPFDSTKLSPFYYTIPPDIEVCNSDIECEVTIIALRRLSLMPIVSSLDSLSDPGTTLGSDNQLTISKDGQSSNVIVTPNSLSPRSPCPLTTVHPSDSRRQSPDITLRLQNVSINASNRESYTTLMRDTDSFIGSLLFKPDPPGYRSVDPAVIPDSTRSWACAAYLYLHLVLWQKDEGKDETGENDSCAGKIPDKLLKWLLDQIRGDLDRTQEMMSLGANCGEMWLWKVIVAAFAAAQQDWSDVGSEYSSEWKTWAVERVQAWSKRSQTLDWAAAKHAVEKIGWVVGTELEDFAEHLWHDAFDDT